jgi:hypothetical protein
MEKEDVYFNKIFIIQSLPSDQRRTGDEIELRIKYLSYRGNLVNVELTDINSSDDLFQTLNSINRLVSSGVLPFIHFEIHGSKQGLSLANNELVEWHKLKDILLDLNKKTKNNLFISLATCYGGHLLKIYKPWEPCPFYGYIGPTEEVYPLDLEASFSEFFETLLTENDFAKAIEKLQLTVDGNSSKYAFLNCYGYFDRLIKLYKEEIDNPRIRKERVKEIIKKYKSRYPENKLTSKELKKEAERLVLTNAEDEEFERMRKIFLHES